MSLDALTSIHLNSIKDSTIANINLYSHRAQITRVFKVDITAGQSKLNISCLPNPIDHDSLRVEAKGPAIIQGVTSFKTEMMYPATTSPLLDELKDHKEKAENALTRCTKALKAIDAYVDKLDAQNLDISKLGEAMDIYDVMEKKWDDKVVKLKKEIEQIEGQIKEEEERLAKSVGNNKLRSEVIVTLFGDIDAELKITLIYVVSGASWGPGYDIRVNMQNQESLVKVIYKAHISQKTGENWENAPITLETAQPTFGVEVPKLAVWNVTHENPGLGKGGARRHRKILPDEDDLEYEEHEAAEVTSKGHVNATFRIPGQTSIPSDDDQHTVTIAELNLEAIMSWVCVPKGDTGVHLNASIKNSSEYAFLPGSSNVYVDQSFISRSEVPSVSPQEVFDCPLGLDPSIRVTYHPAAKMYQESGFYNKSRKHSLSQRITVHNTKSIDIAGLKITDHIPISQDATITVKLVTPALATVTSTTPPKVQVSEGVSAQWMGSESATHDVASLGKDGRLDWICTIPALSKVNLLLEWEVTTTQRTPIYGLH